MPELCSLESVCGQACVYRHIARCVFTTIFINHGVGKVALFDSTPHSSCEIMHSKDNYSETCLRRLLKGLLKRGLCYQVVSLSRVI